MLKFIINKSITILFVIGVIYSTPTHKWQHIETEHFRISYNENTEHLLKQVIQIAEDTVKNIRPLFTEKIFKTRISLVIYDDEDFSNGSAFIYLPIIHIFARQTPFMWRGETDWIKNVLSHELSHIYSMRSIRFPMMVYLGVQYTSSRDNLQADAGMLIANNNIPLWFVEGAAQLGANKNKADFWDPYREMLLKDAFLNKKILSVKEMQRFEGTSRDYELVYNQGFNFLLFLREKYPDKKFSELCNLIKNYDFNKAVNIHYQKSIDTLYNEWIEHLHQQYGEPQKINGISYLFPYSTGPYVNESFTVFNNWFTAANWQNDYNIQNLYLSYAFKNKILARDIGPILKFDKNKKEIYFTKNNYQQKKGVYNFDIYKVKSRNYKNIRITKGARCLAFDITETNLIYARYEKGENTIISRNLKNNYEQELITLPTAIQVYNITALPSGQIILEISADKKVQPYFLQNKILQPVYNNLNFDIRDIQIINDNNIVFCSTINGSPQIYWTALKQPSSWYQITDFPTGARYPYVEIDKNTTNLFYSIYYKGSFKLIKQKNQLNNKNIINPYQQKTAIPLQNKINTNTTYTSSPKNSNLRFNAPLFGIFLSENAYYSPGGAKNYSTDIAGLASFEILNASQNFSAGIELQTVLPQDNILPVLYYMLWSRFNLFKLNNQISYNHSRLKNNVHEKKDYSLYIVDHKGQYQYDEYNLFSAIGLQLMNNSYINFGYRKSWADYFENSSRVYKLHDNRFFWTSTGTQTMTINSVISINSIYIIDRFSILYNFSKNKNLKLDSSGIGQAGRQFTTEYSISDQKYNAQYWSSYYYSTKDETISILDLKYMERFIFLKNKISLAGFIDYFGIYGGSYSYKVAPFSYRSLGGESLFSGYTPGYISAKSGTRFTLDLRLNPFINIFNSIKAYERFHLGFKLETGSYAYIFSGSGGYTITSFEMAFRYLFYIRKNSAGSLYLKYGIPLEKIYYNSNPDPYQLYFGLML